MEKRNYKRIPFSLDLLYEDYVSPEEVKEIAIRLSEVVENNKNYISKGHTLKESRFFIKGQILIQDNYIENKKNVENL